MGPPAKTTTPTSSSSSSARRGAAEPSPDERGKWSLNTYFVNSKVDNTILSLCRLETTQGGSGNAPELKTRRTYARKCRRREQDLRGFFPRSKHKLFSLPSNPIWGRAHSNRSSGLATSQPRLTNGNPIIISPVRPLIAQISSSNVPIARLSCSASLPRAEDPLSPSSIEFHLVKISSHLLYSHPTQQNLWIFVSRTLLLIRSPAWQRILPFWLTKFPETLFKIVFPSSSDKLFKIRQKSEAQWGDKGVQNLQTGK